MARPRQSVAKVTFGRELGLTHLRPRLATLRPPTALRPAVAKCPRSALSHRFLWAGVHGPRLPPRPAVLGSSSQLVRESPGSILKYRCRVVDSV